MTPTVLVVGSLHHDIMVEADHLPRRDETAIGHRWYPKFGGKGGNQAVAVARAGVACRMLGAVGADGFGAYLRAGLQAGGVDDRFVSVLPDVGSGMSVAIQDAVGDYAATIVSGANVRIDPGALADSGLWQGVRLLILQNEVAETLNLAAARAARARSVPVLLNAAPARALPEALVSLVDLLVVNAVEAEMMGAGAVTDLASAADAARQLSQRFGRVIVTAGSQGLAAATPDASDFRLTAEKVLAVSSHGAGDAFVGTLGAGLACGTPFQAAVQAASHAAARHVSGAS
ncbi:MAG: PfkB family carbohydrate kinase [Tabrizicola sp.]|uniref:PfkB family carbohydrate kinase n=1 Tax=Tabrizicola sp. TaxID=2005166 RepID=UPI002ABB003D|nr:PfkB family carbohydrate kinase [Tabrizicola sp.]MDZ4087148.1 PfkB family carbohydrate kinase [Tabrizicola sp.]